MKFPIQIFILSIILNSCQPFFYYAQSIEDIAWTENQSDIIFTYLNYAAPLTPSSGVINKHQIDTESMFEIPAPEFLKNANKTPVFKISPDFKKIAYVDHFGSIYTSLLDGSKKNDLNWLRCFAQRLSAQGKRRK